MQERAAFSWPVRVYYEDTDAGGVVYDDGYLRYLERASTEWLRSHGVMQSELSTGRGIVFAVVAMDIRFLSPARLDDELVATCLLDERRGASLGFTQQLLRASDDAVLIQASVRAACLDAASFRPRPIPEDLILE